MIKPVEVKQEGSLHYYCNSCGAKFNANTGTVHIKANDKVYNTFRTDCPRCGSLETELLPMGE